MISLAILLKRKAYTVQKVIALSNGQCSQVFLKAILLYVCVCIFELANKMLHCCYLDKIQIQKGILHWESCIQYVRNTSRKTNISDPPVTPMFVCVSGGKKCQELNVLTLTEREFSGNNLLVCKDNFIRVSIYDQFGDTAEKKSLYSPKSYCIVKWPMFLGIFKSDFVVRMCVYF